MGLAEPGPVEGATRRAMASEMKAAQEVQEPEPSDHKEQAPGGHRAGGRSGTLKWHHLVGVTFFAVCGGDYGLEDSVGAAGPGLSLLGLLILPWIWSLPIALMTAELGAMIPETGGYVVWVHRAFGPFWAHQNAMWNLVSNAFDNALYPVMFVDYLRYFPAFRKLVGLKRWVVSVTMLGGVTGLNLLGVDVVASASTLFAALVISPFAALTIAGLPSLQFEPLTRSASHPVHWGTFLSVLLWNTSGYGLRAHPAARSYLTHPSFLTMGTLTHARRQPAHCTRTRSPLTPSLRRPTPHTLPRPAHGGLPMADSVGALAADVSQPGRDLPRAMVVTIILVTVVYVLPLAVSISLDVDHLDQWTDGHFTTVAQDHVGDWLSA